MRVIEVTISYNCRLECNNIWRRGASPFWPVGVCVADGFAVPMSHCCVCDWHWCSGSSRHVIYRLNHLVHRVRFCQKHLQKYIQTTGNEFIWTQCHDEYKLCHTTSLTPKHIYTPSIMTRVQLQMRVTYWTRNEWVPMNRYRNIHTIETLYRMPLYKWMRASINATITIREHLADSLNSGPNFRMYITYIYSINFRSMHSRCLLFFKPILPFLIWYIKIDKQTNTVWNIDSVIILLHMPC